MNPNMLVIVDSPEEAPNYRRDSVDIRSAVISKVVIVKKGMENGKSTVDFQFQDNEGNQFVAMLTGALVQQLALIIRGAEQ
jgi:hypothetical protein